MSTSATCAASWSRTVHPRWYIPSVAPASVCEARRAMRTIRWRLTLYHTIAILGISSLLLGIGIVALYQSVRTGVEETTQGRAVAAERLLAQGTLPSSEELVMLTEGEVYLIVRDATGAILATAGTPPLRYDELGADGDRAWQ